MEAVPIDQSHCEFIDSLLSAHFGSGRVVSLGRLHDSASLPGFVALLDGAPSGFVVYELRERDCEIVAIASVTKRRGVARGLVSEVRSVARKAGCERLVLVTTNDNLAAQAFYAALGFSPVAVHKGAVTRARRIKPEIPVLGEGGIPIEDELEYELPAHT